MLFHVYGSDAVCQWIAMLAVLAGLILLNEFARRTKTGGLLMFGVIPCTYGIFCSDCSCGTNGSRVGG